MSIIEPSPAPPHDHLLQTLHADVMSCARCTRLMRHCQTVAQRKRRSFADWTYWAKPVPGFGDPQAWLWIIGLAPAAHGANRTGRVFTGDRSGDFLYASLHRAGLATQPDSTHRDDGLQLCGCYISAAIRCAPPANKPTPREIAACSIFLDREWDRLPRKRVLLALGRIAWDAAIALAARKTGRAFSPRPRFAHSASIRLAPDLSLVGSYHVSQQNTFTGRLTQRMFDNLIHDCRHLP